MIGVRRLVVVAVVRRRIQDVELLARLDRLRRGDVDRTNIPTHAATVSSSRAQRRCRIDTRKGSSHCPSGIDAAPRGVASRPMADEHPFAMLAATWRGTGHGEYPTIASFEYTEEFVITPVPGRPVAHWRSATRDAATGEPRHAESGFLRTTPNGIELVVAHTFGIVEAAAGRSTGTCSRSGRPACWALRRQSRSTRSSVATSSTATRCDTRSRCQPSAWG